MDGYLIYEFTTMAEAEHVLTAIDEMAVTYWAARGYSIFVNPDTGLQEVVGKKGGVDVINVQNTISWSEISESPDGTFYFASLTNDIKFAKGTQNLIAGGYVINEKIMPAIWATSEEIV